MKIKHLDRYKQSSIKTFDRWKNYDECIFLRIFTTESWSRAIVSKIDQMQDASILEVGCGTGRILEALTEYKPGKLCGMDISEGILETAAKKPCIKEYGIELKLGDAETEIPWSDGSFDYVVMSGVFHHFYRPLDALKECRRVLKEMGTLIVVDPDFPFWARIPMNVFLGLIPVRGDFRFHPPSAVDTSLCKIGFQNITRQPVPRLSFMITAQK